MGKDAGTGPQGVGKQRPPDEPLWLLPLALSDVSCCFLALSGCSFRDNFCFSVFASTLSLSIQGLYIFLRYFSPTVQSLGWDNARSYYGLLPLLLLAFLSYLFKGEGKTWILP